MDNNRTVGVNGRVIVPNSFSLHVSQTDFDELADFLGTLRRELADEVRSHAREEGYTFLGPVEISIDVDDRLGRGKLTGVGRIVEGEGARPARQRVAADRGSCRPG